MGGKLPLIDTNGLSDLPANNLRIATELRIVGLALTSCMRWVGYPA